MEIDIFSALEAQWEDGYEKIKNFLSPSEELDYQELVDKGSILWKTAKGDLKISIEINTVSISITVYGISDYYGYCSTMDFDTYGVACCTMSALRDYIKNNKEALENIPT